jgi:hypothetical protein
MTMKVIELRCYSTGFESLCQLPESIRGYLKNSASSRCLCGSGVKETHYSIDGGPETVVPGASASFAVSSEGIHTVTYSAMAGTV